MISASATQPVVSVVIPVFNGASFVADAIRSALAQTYPWFEVIVVDDGSTDASADIARASGERVRVLRVPHGGVSAARNAAVAVSTGPLIAFLDADDIWAPDKLARQVALLAGARDLVAVFTASTGLDLRTGRTSQLATRHAADMLGVLVLDGPVVGPGSTAVVLTQAFHRVGGFDPRIANGEDWDLWLRLAEIGAFGFIDEPLAIIRTHGANASRNVRRAERDNEFVLDKFFARRPHARSLRRSAYANHYLRHAGSHLHLGTITDSLRCLAQAILRQPRYVRRALLTPIRRARRRGSTD